MKNILLIFLFFSLIFEGCISSRKQIQRGNYDAAIYVSAKKLLRKPEKEKEIINLDKAYKYAMQKDNERIVFLKKGGQPDIWEEVFSIYENMKNRQEKVRILPQNVLTAIGYKFQDFDNEIIEARKKAADFLYTYSIKLLQNNDKASARQAYDQLLRVKNYYASYKDVDTYLQKASQLGTTYILFTMKNNTGIPLPPSFETELQKISLYDLNSEWLRFETVKQDDRNYEYIILLNITLIDVSPEGLKETHYSEKKEIADGFKYVYDAHGNVMKDSLGNDIKTPKTKIINCDIIETQQHKAVTISGTLDFIDLNNSQVIKTDPISSQFFFDHLFAVAQGNWDALRPETKEKLNSRPLPFPNDFEMILNAGSIIKDISRKIISQNKNLIY